MKDSLASLSGLMTTSLIASGFHDSTQASTEQSRHPLVKADPHEFNELWLRNHSRVYWSFLQLTLTCTSKTALASFIKSCSRISGLGTDYNGGLEFPQLSNLPSPYFIKEYSPGLNGLTGAFVTFQPQQRACGVDCFHSNTRERIAHFCMTNSSNSQFPLALSVSILLGGSSLCISIQFHQFNKHWFSTTQFQALS